RLEDWRRGCRRAATRRARCRTARLRPWRSCIAGPGRRARGQTDRACRPPFAEPAPPGWACHPRFAAHLQLDSATTEPIRWPAVLLRQQIDRQRVESDAYSLHSVAPHWRECRILPHVRWIADRF